MSLSSEALGWLPFRAQMLERLFDLARCQAIKRGQAGFQLDLGEIDESGHFKRSILETVDPAPYGIRVGDYFL